jgi:hypothetical protein
LPDILIGVRKIAAVQAGRKRFAEKTDDSPPVAQIPPLSRRSEGSAFVCDAQHIESIERRGRRSYNVGDCDRPIRAQPSEEMTQTSAIFASANPVVAAMAPAQTKLRALVSRLFLAAAVTTSLLGNGVSGAHAEDAGLSAKDKKLYQQAFQAVEKDRWKEARRLADLAKEPLPAKVIQWLDLSRPGPGRSFDEMTRFLKANPDWPLRETLTAQAERTMPDIYPTASVLGWFGPRDPLTAQGAIKLLGALRADGQADRARKVAVLAWTTEDFTQDQEATFLARFGDMLTMADHVVRLDRLLWEDERDQAVRMLKRVDAGHAALASARMRLRDQKVSPDAAGGLVPLELRDDAGLIYDRGRTSCGMSSIAPRASCSPMAMSVLPTAWRRRIMPIPATRWWKVNGSPAGSPCAISMSPMSPASTSPISITAPNR